MAANGSRPAEQRSRPSPDGIGLIACFVPAIVIAIGVGIMLAYPLTEKTFTAMLAEMPARRAARAADTDSTTTQEA